MPPFINCLNHTCVDRWMEETAGNGDPITLDSMESQETVSGFW